MRAAGGNDGGSVDLDEACSASSRTCRSCTRWSPPSWPPAARARRAPRPGPRSAAAAPSRGSRRAPVGPGRVPAARPLAGRWRRPRSQAPQLRPADPKKMIRLALCSALSDRRPTTRSSSSTRGRFDAPRPGRPPAAGRPRRRPAGRSSSWATTTTAPKSFRNLPDVHLLPAGELNTYDVLVTDFVVFTRDTLPRRRPRSSRRRTRASRRRPPAKRPSQRHAKVARRSPRRPAGAVLTSAEMTPQADEAGRRATRARPTTRRGDQS